MGDLYAPCPECYGLNHNHKFSCSRNTGNPEAAVAEWGEATHWSQYRSKGNVASLYYAGEASYFDTKLVSPVVGNLWQGGCKQDVYLGSDFATVVSLYPWERYALDDGVDLYEFEMYDSSEGVEFVHLFKASEAVLKGLAKGKTLVHCQAGLNRSGLVAAFTLMRLGYSSADAINLLRESRSSFVLCNRAFVKQLGTLDRNRELMESLQAKDVTLDV